MPITYDAGTNTITVTGYTEATPCTFLDIYNADVAGGWGVVSRQCLNQYCFNAKLAIGDGSTTTWFADIQQQIVFPDGWAALNDIMIEVLLNAHFRLGEHISGYRTQYGCSLLFLEDSTSIFPIKGNVPLCSPNVELYGCTFRGIEGIDNRIGRLDAPKIYECIFDGIYMIRLKNVDINRISMINTVDGLSLVYGTLKDIFIHDNGSAIWAEGDTDLTVEGGVFRGNTDILNCYSGSFDAYLIDLDVDNWLFDFRYGWAGKAYRQYSFDLKVQDKDENAISGAAVKIWDKDDNLVVNVTTGADGTIATQTLNYGYYTYSGGNTPVMQTPHTIEISKAGYQTYKKKFTMDEKIDWRIRLLRANPIQFLENEPILQLCPESQEDDSIVFAAL